jgi:hypothetical protein
MAIAMSKRFARSVVQTLSDNTKRRGGRRSNPGGRPPKPIEERKEWKGKIAIRISPDSAALAQRLMLHFPQVATVEALYEYALIRLAETTDD